MSEPSLSETLPQRHAERRNEAYLWTILTMIVVAVGVALRIWILRSPAGRLDSDEAVVALMADSIRSGRKPNLFFAGQFYGGMYEPILAAVTLSISRSVLALKAVPLICSAIAALLTTRIARRIVAPPPARLAGAMLFAWPGTTWLATKERGFYWVMLIFVLIAMLSAVRLAKHEPRRIATWCVYGAAAGSAWYTSPQSAYVVLPLSCWVAFTQRPQWSEVSAAAAGLGLGSAPWLYGLATFGTKVLHQEPAAAAYPDRLRGVAVELLPRVLGTRRVFANGWTLGPIGIALSVAVAATLFTASIMMVKARRTSAGGKARGADVPALLCLLALAFPFLAALPSLATFTAEPRYGLLLIPTVVLALAMFATNLRRGVVISMCVAALAVVSTVDLVRTAREDPQSHLDLAPPETRALEHMLKTANVTRVYADYWVAYPLTFRASNGLVASPVDLPRIGTVQQTVDAAKPTTWIVYVDSTRDHALAAELRRRNVSTTRISVGPFAVYTLDRYIDPLTLDRFWVQHPPGR